MLGTVYSPKIAKINSQQEKTIRLNSKNLSQTPPPPRLQEKIAKLQNLLSQKFRGTR